MKTKAIIQQQQQQQHHRKQQQHHQKQNQKLLSSRISLLLLLLAVSGVAVVHAFSASLSSSSSSKRKRTTTSIQSSSLFAVHTTTTARRPFLFTTVASAMSASSASASEQQQPSLFWNRELSAREAFLSTNADTITRPCRLIAICNPNDSANDPLLTPASSSSLPDGVELVAVLDASNSVESVLELLKERQNQQLSPVNAVFVSHPQSREPLAKLLESDYGSSIEWIHTRSAGIDFVTSSALTKWYSSSSSQQQPKAMTNAKGAFSSTLAEYTMMACSYFAKDLPRLMQQKQDQNWQQYPVLELRGATLGIVGYGDIGHAAARLAKAYGMNILALQRSRRKITSRIMIGNNDNNNGEQQQEKDRVQDEKDAICNEILYSDEDKNALTKLFARSDYVLCAAPLTSKTRGMIGLEQFQNCKPGCVFINVGRGPIVDEDALIEALSQQQQQSQVPLKGAALDVFATEPLPKTSPLWTLNNVLLSPHNMDMTRTFMHESTDFFVQEQLPRFVRGLPLLNPVDPAAGY